MSSVRKAAALLFAILVPVILASAAEVEPAKESHVTKATCHIHGLGKNKISGTVKFTQKGDEVVIEGTIKGLTPGKHGFHVHQFGDLGSADGLSAGGHFDPEHKMHGGPKSEDRHVGDLGNIEANDEGIATIKKMDKIISLHGPHSILGRSIIVHAKQDDLKDIKSAGARVAGGVIGVGKP
jgi:Cu-Zn family superoxide dismutase